MAVGSSIGHAIGHFLSSHIPDAGSVSAILAEVAAVAAFFGSCCALPLLLMFTGVGSMAFAITLVPYRPYFIVATVLMLGISFYLVYGRKPSCSSGACSLKKIRRTKMLLWLSASFVTIFLVGPYVYEMAIKDI